MKPGIDGVGMLTDTTIRKTKAQDKPYKLTDTNGLPVGRPPIQPPWCRALWFRFIGVGVQR